MANYEYPLQHVGGGRMMAATIGEPGQVLNAPNFAAAGGTPQQGGASKETPLPLPSMNFNSADDDLLVDNSDGPLKRPSLDRHYAAVAEAERAASGRPTINATAGRPAAKGVETPLPLPSMTY